MNPTATLHIINFIKSIGIDVSYDAIKTGTFVPGIAIKNGGIVVDAEKLKYPGDLLREAGYIAVTPKSKRTELNDTAQAIAEDSEQKVAMIAWVYAAAKHLGLDSSAVFHESGYKSDSASLIKNFDAVQYSGVPMLELYGMAYGEEKAAELGKEAYPGMVNWLSQQ